MMKTKRIGDSVRRRPFQYRIDYSEYSGGDSGVEYTLEVLGSLCHFNSIQGSQ